MRKYTIVSMTSSDPWPRFQDNSIFSKSNI